MSVYVFIISFSPLLNKFIRNLNKLGFAVFLFFFLKFWYTYSFSSNTGFKNFERGLMYYLIGAFIKLHSKRLNYYWNIINLFLCVISYKYTLIIKYITIILEFQLLPPYYLDFLRELI